MHDLVIKGATIVDGTGAPATTGDIAIDGVHLTDVGGTAGRARQAGAAGRVNIARVGHAARVAFFHVCVKCIARVVYTLWL